MLIARFLVFVLPLLALTVGRTAHAQAKPTDSDETEPSEEPPPPPTATIQLHRYTLAECLALADRNHPSLWAARARLAFVHAQLDEAKWTPYFQWTAQAATGVVPPILGTAIYTQST